MSATFPGTAIPSRRPVSGRGRANKVGSIAEHRRLETRPEMPPLSNWPLLRHCQVKADQKNQTRTPRSGLGAGETLSSHAERGEKTARLAGVLRSEERRVGKEGR